MVQVSDAKFNMYGLANNGKTVGPTCDKLQPVVLEKKVPLRDLPNENRNNIPQHEDSLLPTKDRDPSSKKQKTDCTTQLCHQSCNNDASNGQLVYVRRKAEQESGKKNNYNSKDKEKESPSGIQNSENPDLGGLRNHLQGPKSFPMPSPVTLSPGAPPLPHSIGKPGNVLGSNQISINPQRAGNQHWKERFVRLQMHLKKCDQSNQEEYIRALRSLSAAGRSRHAVDLEKRAIHLLLEEGKEMHRMKVLNILGRTAPNKFLDPTQAHSQQVV